MKSSDFTFVIDTQPEPLPGIARQAPQPVNDAMADLIDALQAAICRADRVQSQRDGVVQAGFTVARDDWDNSTLALIVEAARVRADLTVEGGQAVSVTAGKEGDTDART